MNLNTEHNRPDYNTLPGMIINIAKNDQDMKGDESHVWFVLGTLWQEYGVNYNPPIELLISLCKRSERFIRDAMKKLREKLLVAFGRAQYTPGDRIKEAIYAFSNGEICPKAAIYAEKQTAEYAERQNMPNGTAHIAERRQNMPKQTAEYAETPKPLARANIDNNNNIYNNKYISHTQNTCEGIKSASQVDWEKLEGPLEELGHGVTINCKTIRHENFIISLDGIEMAVMNRGFTREDIRSTASGFALQWAVEIGAGKKPDRVVPAHISNFISSNMRRASNEDAVTKAKAERFSKPLYGNNQTKKTKFQPSLETRKKMDELAEAKALLGID